MDTTRIHVAAVVPQWGTAGRRCWWNLDHCIGVSQSRRATKFVVSRSEVGQRSIVYIEIGRNYNIWPNTKTRDFL